MRSTDDTTLARWGYSVGLSPTSVDFDWLLGSIPVCLRGVTVHITEGKKHINDSILPHIVRAINSSHHNPENIFDFDLTTPISFNMSYNQQILRSEVILEKYGKALTGKTGNYPLNTFKRTEANQLAPIVLITGVSDDSIAGELAVQLASADPALLILTARAESKVVGIEERIHLAKPNVKTRFLRMDLSDLSAVRGAVEELTDVAHIDHLVCVAGVMFPPYSKTKDGFESQLGVNYLANFVLVKLLLPKVRAAGPSSSIVIMASSMARQGKVHFDDVQFSVSTTPNLLDWLVLNADP